MSASFTRIASGAYRSSNLVPVEIHRSGSGRTPWIVTVLGETKMSNGETRPFGFVVQEFATLADAKAFATPLINHPQGCAAAEGFALMAERKLQGFGGHERARRHLDRMVGYLLAWRTRTVLASGMPTVTMGRDAVTEETFVLMPARDGGDGWPYFMKRELGEEATNPENVSDRRALSSLIAELSGEDYVTTSEAAAVIDWCRLWLEDCEPETVWDGNSDAHCLRVSHRHIEGGLAFVLEDVRRLAKCARCEVNPSQANSSLCDPCETGLEVAREEGSEAATEAARERACELGMIDSTDAPELVVVDLENVPNRIIGKFIRSDEDAVAYSGSQGLSWAPADCVTVLPADEAANLYGIPESAQVGALRAGAKALRAIGGTIHAAELEAMAAKLAAIQAQPIVGGCPEADVPAEAFLVAREDMPAIRARLARAAVSFTEEAWQPGITRVVVASSFLVERQHSGTEDGWLWYVIDPTGARVGDGGWIYREPAEWEAANLTRVAKLNSAQRAALEPMRANCADGSFSAAWVSDNHEVHYYLHANRPTDAEEGDNRTDAAQAYVLSTFLATVPASEGGYFLTVDAEVLTFDEAAVLAGGCPNQCPLCGGTSATCHCD